MTLYDLLLQMVPEGLVLLTGFVLLTVDLVGQQRRRKDAARTAEPHGKRSLIAATITTVGVLAAVLWLARGYGQPRVQTPAGLFVLDPLVILVKQALLGLTVMTAWLSRPCRFTEHVGEYFLMLLLAAVGMMFLVSSENLLMIFVALELVSLSLYILTAFNKRDLRSAEAAVKYFLFGGMSAAFMLYGLSWLYGCTGELALAGIAAKLGPIRTDPLLFLAMAMVAIGLGFKIAAVPFHLWAPDTYQGAPVPSAAFIASGSKLASFFILAKLMIYGLAGAAGSGAWGGFVPGWMPLIAIMAALSIVLGNLAAIVQGSVRRLLAYSAVAQAGYMLTAVLASDPAGVSALLFYAITYAMTTLGAFGVVGIVQEHSGSDRVSAFTGLSRRAPVLSFCMLVFLLSLAGIPPLAGFFGKFYLFAAALHATPRLGWLWLVMLGIGMSAVALYYYLVVLKAIYVEPPAAEARPITAPWLTRLAIVLLAAGVIVLGCWPNLLVGRLAELTRHVGLISGP